MIKWFNRVVWTGLILVYLVILAGSIVRMTGSGMGCPDWPKCFGKWIPPTDVSELPEDYKQNYVQKRELKILKFSNLLENVGFKREAEKIRNDKTLLEEEDFNASKTWTEYVNRLVGFLSGIFFLLAFILSLFLIKHKKSLFFFSALNLIIIVFQAWFGSIVVATNLLPWTISLHMLLAFLIVGLQIQLVRLSSTKPHDSAFSTIDKKTKWIFLILTLLLITQVFMGTQVRQNVDNLITSGIERSQIPDNFDWIFFVHRTFSILVFIVYVYICYSLRNSFGLLMGVILTLVVLEIGLGVIMYYVGIPAWTQPIHLLLASLLFGLQVHWLLNAFSQKIMTNK